MSNLPSELKSPRDIPPNELLAVLKLIGLAKLIFPGPVLKFHSTDILLELLFPVTKSGLPSPSISPTAKV